MTSTTITLLYRSVSLGVVCLFFGYAFLQGKALVLPVEAIDDTAKLSAEEFNKKHTGIDISGYYPDDPGFYVSYTHENLTYYFGPLEEYIEAINWKDKLVAVREEVIYERPSLSSSEIVIYNFSLEVIEEQGRKMKEGEGSDGSSNGEFGQMVGQPGQDAEQGQESGIFLPQGGAQSDQSGQQQGQSGSQEGQRGSSSGQQGIQIIQFPGQQQSGQSSNSSSSSGSSSGGSGSSSGGGGGGGGKPSWWEIIKGIFGG